MGAGHLPKGFKNTRAHFFFDVKNGDRHKTRLVSDGHLTDVLLSSAYSGVVPLRVVRLVLFLDDRNGLGSWVTDIGDAYLEAFTKEKICIMSRPECRPLEGQTLIINKALYAMRTSFLY